MKHIKLFEDFNEDIYIEDAKYIIISHLGEGKDIPIDPKWNAKDILRFKLEETPTDDQISKCGQHLKEEGFFLFIRDYSCVVGIGNSLDEYCQNWLNTNYGDLKPVVNEEGDTNYVDIEGNNMIHISNDDVNNYKINHYFIDYDLIWSFFEIIFELELNEIREITGKWLEKTYNLNKLKTSWSTHLRVL